MIEVRTFRPLAGVDEDSLRAADTVVQRALMLDHPGFLRRTVGHRDGSWVAVTFWYSERDANAAEVDATAPFAALIDAASSTVVRVDDLGG